MEYRYIVNIVYKNKIDATHKEILVSCENQRFWRSFYRINFCHFIQWATFSLLLHTYIYVGAKSKKIFYLPSMLFQPSWWRCTRVSVQGVESLWGLFRQIGGHSSRFVLFHSFWRLLTIKMIKSVKVFPFWNKSHFFLPPAPVLYTVGQ